MEAVKAVVKDGTEVVVRSARPEDAAPLLDAMRIVMRESKHLLTEIDEFKYTVEQEAELVATHLNHPDKLWLIPLVDGKIVGALNFSIGGKKRNSHQGAFGVSLLPDFQGLGIGRLLMDIFLEWAEDNPRVECVRLQVHAENVAASRLYEDLGFREEGREKKGVKFSDGTYDDVLLMARDV
ncbi:MAG: N-acetyltransferase [Bdellovibrionota bacterium]